MIFSEDVPSNEHLYPPTKNVDESNNLLPILIVNGKFQLSMLLYLLIDGQQVIVDEIDRVLVYLLGKK